MLASSFKIERIDFYEKENKWNRVAFNNSSGELSYNLGFIFNI